MTTAEMTSPRDPRPRRAEGLRDWAGAWEIALFGLLLIVLVVGAVWSPYFLTLENFQITAAGAVGIALMVIPMTWIIIAGEIDLSVASVFGLAGVVFGLLVQGGVGLFPAILAGFGVGLIAGLVNALFSIRLGLPSLIVTVATLSIFRGLAFVLLETQSVNSLPPAFAEFAQGHVPGTPIPNTFIVFLAVAAIGAVLLQKGTVGRETYAIGSSTQVSRFSGVRVQRVKLGLFVFSGLVASLAGVLYAGYVNSVRADNGSGLELTVVAIVLIGGVSMYGGKGRVLGVLLALILVIAVRSLMALAYVQTNIQYMVVGLLMIGAVVVPAIVNRLKAGRRGSLSQRTGREE